MIVQRSLIVGLMMWSSLQGGEAEWPQFRGKLGSAQAGNVQIPEEWSIEKNLAWKTKVPGAGWAQPIVVGQSIFVATAVSDPPLTPKNMMAGVMDPRSRPNSANKGPAPGPDVKIDWQLLCLDKDTGSVRWTKSISTGKPKYAIHPSNTYATETPCSDGERVFVFFGATGIVVALDLQGKEIWRKDYGAFPGNADLGLGASPALDGSLLYVPLLNETKSAVVALDTKTGAEKFVIERKQPGTSWATPFIWSNKARKELVICGRGSVTGHDPQTGKELWSLGGIDSSFSSTPAATESIIVFGNGGPGSKSPLFGIKAGASGDITLKEKETKNEFVAFYKLAAAPGMASPVAVDSLVYVLNNGGLSCIDPLTGEVKYKERLPKARTVAASPFVAQGRIYFLDESGTMVTVKAGKDFEAVASNKIDDTFWASPTPLNDGVLLRGVNFLYRIKK